MSFGITAAVVGAGATIYSANQASKTAKNAAAQAAWQPTAIQGPNGENIQSSWIDPQTGRQMFGGTGFESGFSGQNTLGGQGALNRFSNLQGQVYNSQGQPINPNAALDPRTGQALNAADQSLQTTTPNFFSPGGQGAFQALGGQANQAANQGAQGLFSALGPNGAPAYSDALGQGYTGAAANALDALGNFDPNAYAANAKAQLDALAAPGETSDTQSLFNRLQSTGRLGLTQNGELGDIGGLDLAQRTANNQRALQAAQLGQQAQAQLVSNAGALGGAAGSAFGTGANLRTSAAGLFSGLQGTAQNADTFGFNRLLGQNNLSQQNALARFQLAGQGLGLANSQLGNLQGLGLNALQGNLSIDTQNLNALNAASNASAVRSGAGSNAGALSVGAANNNANNYGALFAGLAPSIGKAIFNPTPAPQTFGGGGFISTPNSFTQTPGAPPSSQAFGNLDQFFSPGGV